MPVLFALQYSLKSYGRKKAMAERMHAYSMHDHEARVGDDFPLSLSQERV